MSQEIDKCKHCGEEVVFEIDGLDQTCPECGWTKSASEKSENVEEPQKKKVKKFTPLPWMISGFLTHAIMEILGMVFALVLKRVTWSRAMLQAAAILTIGVGAIGAVLGLLFAYVHDNITRISLTLKGIIYFVIIAVLMQLIVDGIKSLATSDFAFTLVTSAFFGALFVRLGLWFRARLVVGSNQLKDKNIRIALVLLVSGVIVMGIGIILGLGDLLVGIGGTAINVGFWWLLYLFFKRYFKRRGL